MYFVIGADGKQYGPISAEQVRMWLAQGRVNAQSMVKTEVAPDWKPLVSFPEFASSIPFGAAPPVIPRHSSDVSSKKLAAGICGILVGAFGVHKFILGYNGTGGIMLALSLGSLVGGVFTCGLLWPIIWVMPVIGMVEGIIYLCKSDDEFERTYIQHRREWF